jgi:hypothetical protein
VALPAATGYVADIRRLAAGQKRVKHGRKR